MKFLFLTLLFVSNLNLQDKRAIETLESELYPQDYEIMMLIENEIERLKFKKLGKEFVFSVCPIEIDYWYNLNCA